jgi:catechol 2,3-dioxygenase-like lactoylglutathione lyase family enzyme
MTTYLSHASILVLDQDAALAFYRDALGLEVRSDNAWEGARWLTVGPPTQPEVQILLETIELRPRGGPDADALRALVTKGAMPSLIFETDDVDAAFEKARATGAEVLQEPMDQPYGVRDCAFRDPSGNMVRLNSKAPR